MKNFDGWLWDGQSFTGPKLLSRPFLYRSDNFYRSYITNIENILRSFIGSNVSTPSFHLRNENIFVLGGRKQFQEKEDERDVRGIGESLELDNIRKYWFHGIRTYSDFWRYPDYIQGSDCGVCCLVAVLNNCCSFHNDVSPRLFKMVRTQKTYSGTK